MSIESGVGGDVDAAVGVVRRRPSARYSRRAAMLGLAAMGAGVAGVSADLVSADPADAQTSGPGVLDASTFSGSDAGARIEAALQALPPTGGVIDARNLVPILTSPAFDCSINSTITVNCPLQLLLGAATYPINAPIGFAINGQNFSVVGVARGTTAIQMTYFGGKIFSPNGVWAVDTADRDPDGDSLSQAPVSASPD